MPSPLEAKQEPQILQKKMETNNQQGQTQTQMTHKRQKLEETSSNAYDKNSKDTSVKEMQ